MSGRSGGNRRGKEPKASQNPGSGKMGGPTQPNLQKQGGAPTPKEPAPNDKHSEFSSKLQPTAEQIRLATLIQDSSKIAQSDEETATKIRELVELTKCDGDKAALVLHDCDYDLMKAVDAILEGGEPVEQQWTESVSRKKKKQQSQPLKDEGTNEDAWDIRQDDGRDKSKRGVKGLIGAGGAANGQRRGAERSGRGGPPRLRRGRGGGTAGSPREGDGKGFEADFGEDGRGRRAVNGPGRGGRGGRGGGRVPRTFRNQQQSPDVEGFPQSIDTWTNSQAEGYSDSTKTRDLKVGRWDDDFPSTDDWDNEEWTGSLADTRVFTPSSATAPGPNPAAPAQVVPSYDDEKEVEELPKPIGSGASAEKAPSSMPAPAAVPEAPVSPNIPKQLAGPPGLSYSPHHQGSATLDLATLLGTKPSQPQQQPADMGDQRYMNPMKPVTNEVSQPPTNDSVNLFPQMSGQSQQGSGVPVQRSRLKPRPSKIPATAVEMPHDPIAVLDVQFGGLAFSEISSPPGTGSTVASDPSIVSYSVATSSSLPQSSVPSYAPPKDNSSVPTTVGGVERKPTASPGTSYYNTASHATPPPAQVSSAPSHAPPSTSATGMEGSEQVHHQQAVNGPYAPPQSTQGYAVIQPGQYGVKPPSTGAETVVSGGMYAGSYQPNMNGAPSAGKIPPATQNTKDNLPSTSVAPPAAYRQNAAPSKDGVGVGKPQMQMAGYPAPVTAGAPGMAPIVGHQFYAVGPPPTGPPHYYQTQQVYPVPDDLSLLTQRMPPMQSATAAPTVSTSSNRDSSAAGSGLVGHHQYQTSSSDKYGQTATTSAPVSVAGTNVQVRGGEQGSASPAAPTAAVPTAIPVSQPSAAHYAHAPLPLFINYQQQYQGMVPTTFPATAFQTHIFPVPQAANNVHGHGSNSSSQYQKPNAFVQHPYSYSHDHIGNAEYGKSYLSNSKPTAQSGMGGGAPTMQGSDVGMYGNKKVAVSRGYDKFNPSTPQMAGTAGPSPHYGQYHPAMVISGLPPTANAAAGPQAQQHPSQMSMPVHAQSYMQDGSGANRNPGGMPGQNKVPSKPGGYGTGWSY